MTAISPLTPDAYATQQVYQARRSLDDGQMLNEVAGRLGIEPSKLQDAIQQARSEGKDGKDLLASVANQLGIQPDALQQAFMQAGRGPRVHGHHHHHHHAEQTPSTTSPTSEQIPAAPVQAADGNLNISA